jgi:hypothetical protein
VVLIGPRSWSWRSSARLGIPWRSEPSHRIVVNFVGSGLGALVSLLEHRDASSLFPNLEFPATHNTAVLRAAYVFSYLTCVTRLAGDVSLPHQMLPHHPRPPGSRPVPHHAHRIGPSPACAGLTVTPSPLFSSSDNGPYRSVRDWPECASAAGVRAAGDAREARGGVYGRSVARAGQLGERAWARATVRQARNE